METVNKISSGIKWAIGTYILFLIAALLNSYLTISHDFAANFPMALYFSIYGAAAGFIFGYIEEEAIESRSKVIAKAPRPQKSPGFFSLLIRVIVGIFENLKVIFYLAILAAAIYIYYRYIKR